MPAARLSIETSSLHLDLIADLRRINSHICSIAYPILEQAGVLARTRLKTPEAEETAASPSGEDAAWQEPKTKTAGA